MRFIALPKPFVCQLAIVAALSWAHPAPAAESQGPKPKPSAADSIAEKFAREAAAAEARRKRAAKEAAAHAARKQREEQRRRAAERLKADEAEMLARARREAEQRWLAEAEAERKREEARESDQARIAAERLDAERRARAEMASAAAAAAARAKLAAESERHKREAEQRALEERTRRAAIAKERLAQEEAAREAREAQDRRMAKIRAEAKRIAEEEAREAETFAESHRSAERRRQEPMVDLAAEARHLADELEETARDRARLAKRGFDRRFATDENDPAVRPDDQLFSDRRPVTVREPRDQIERPREELFANGRRDDRVAVLLVIEPRATRGWRRLARRLNPILCADDGCYVSQGASEPADFRSRHAAMGLGARAGECRGDDTCVFREVDVAGSARAFQPVSLRVLRHDRREARTLAPDWSCRIERRALSCGAPVVTDTYRMWIVPEAIADRAGPHMLEDALNRGLVSPFSASAQRNGAP